MRLTTARTDSGVARGCSCCCSGERLAAVVAMVGLAAVVGMDSMELVLEGHLELVATETVELCLDGLVSGAGWRST